MDGIEIAIRVRHPSHDVLLDPDAIIRHVFDFLEWQQGWFSEGVSP